MTVYSATQAANVCQVSLRTVQRRIPQLEAAGAWKDVDGKWCIPVEAMTAAGLAPGRPAPPDKPLRQQLRQPNLSQDMSHDTTAEAETAEWRLRADLEVAQWRRRAEVAEALAVERERIIAAQALALKMLEAAPPTAPHSPPPTPPAVPEPSPDPAAAGRRPFWFRRRRPQPVAK
ncbi:MAG: hypothetical protein K0U84_09975 [Actinomycetia bacterium]|nr:hypothetical protein [Actinomycetes bacterium]